MNIVFLAVPLAIVLGVAFMFGFFWSVKHDQFEDLETPAHRILFEDDKELTQEKS